MGNIITIHETYRDMDDGKYYAQVDFIFGSDIERCVIPLEYWTLNRYIDQWSEAVRVVLNGGDRSAIITTIYEACKSDNLVAWVMYTDGNSKIIIQQQLLFPRSKYFQNDSMLYEAIRDREIVNCDGDQISEWTISRTVLEQQFSSSHHNLFDSQFP
ncbi:MAG: hypothetical protein ABGY75_05035 [Gemmataceae bacterium]